MLETFYILLMLPWVIFWLLALAGAGILIFALWAAVIGLYKGIKSIFTTE